MTETLTARYYTADGKSGDDRPLPGEPFDGRVHEESLYAAVKAYLANQRRGTASAKTRDQVRGGGRKPWRQKGTGRARHGSIRSPIWRGGGVIFPPIPKSHRQELPRKVKRLARRSAFNARVNEDRLVVVADLEMERPRTRDLVKLLGKIGIAEEKVLILTAGPKEMVKLSGRNIPNVEIMPYGMESAYDVLWADRVVIEESALETPWGTDGSTATEADADDEPAAPEPEETTEPESGTKTTKAEAKKTTKAEAEESDEPDEPDETAEAEESEEASDA